MVADQFPMFKLATLLARQLSSPIATRVKTLAKSHPRFGVAVCVRVAGWYRAGEWAARLWALRLAGTALRPTPSPPLPLQRAINLGADLIGEIVIFTLGSLIIIFEYNRQGAIKDVKTLHIKSEWLAIKLSLEELQVEVALQQQDINRLHQMLLDLASPTPHTPPHPSTSQDHIPRSHGIDDSQIPHTLKVPRIHTPSRKSHNPHTPHPPHPADSSLEPHIPSTPLIPHSPHILDKSRIPHTPHGMNTLLTPHDSQTLENPHPSHTLPDSPTPYAPHAPSDLQTPVTPHTPHLPHTPDASPTASLKDPELKTKVEHDDHSTEDQKKGHI